MKPVLAFILTIIVIPELFAQAQSSSVITASQYYDTPGAYLAPISSSKISTGVLIDRTIFQNLILNVNGVSTVTSINSGDFATMYIQLRNASYDTTKLEPFDVITDLAVKYYSRMQSYTIGIMDFKFNRINASALSSGQLTQGTSTIVDNSANSGSFSNERAIFASPLTQNITGDVARFTLSSFFYHTNVAGKRVKKVEIDFGNGEGYKTVAFDAPIEISYPTTSGFVSINTKLTMEDITTLATEIFYAHSSVFHTGSETVPLPDPVPTPTPPNGRVAPSRTFLYPAAVLLGFETECHKCRNNDDCCQYFPIYQNGIEPVLDVALLYSTVNSTGKLRRPLIIVEGFDPGDIRNYYERYLPVSPDPGTPRAYDSRGLYQLLNGDPSPWYPGVTSPNMIDNLRADGYDLIFINFIKSEQDIRVNANALRGLFNNVLNGSSYRDNLTEEAVLIGASMGGMVTRYALNAMEAAQEQHYVKLWYSMDAPHKGAAIPLAMQESVNFLSKIHDAGGIIDKLENAKSTFMATRESLNSYAAKQMVIHHHESTTSQGTPDPKFTEFYGELGNTYPKFSWNTGITMGGKTNLYSTTSDIIDFRIFSWTWVWGRGNTNFSSSQKIFEGSRQGWFNDEEVYTANQISFENAPGGWNPALYALNVNSGNKHQKHDVLSDAEDISYNWFSFMSTSSALGMPVTISSVFKTWENYATAAGVPTNSAIPFDRVKGMENNEEHVTISPSTATWFIGNLREDFDNSVRPRVRAGQVNNQKVSKPVAYTAKNTLTFGGSGNSISFESTADVRINAGTSIIFKPGTTIKLGAVLQAKIKPITYGTLNTGRTNAFPGTRAVNLMEKSPYHYQVFDYSTSTGLEKIDIKLSIVVYPNPANDVLNIVAGGSHGQLRIDIYNSVGQVISNFPAVSGTSQVLDVTSYTPGIYIAKVSDEFGHEKSIKFVRK
jgi:hypothetical protein